MNSYLLPALEASPEIMERLIRRIDPAKMDIPTYEGRFTPREVIAHLADWEPIMREERINGAFTNEGSECAAYDEGDRAIEKGYANLNPLDQAAKFKSERRKTLELLRSTPAELWKNSIRHPERGLQSVETLANLIVGHDMYHVEQLTKVLD